MKREPRLETQLVHAGEPQPRPGGAVSLPIFQSSTFESVPGQGYHDLRYVRLSNTPNHLALHAKLAALEKAEDALVTASGMAAISTTMLATLSAGDHFLAHRVLYGGTQDLFAGDLPKLGIECTFVDASNPAEWERAVRPNTRAFYVEAITNPLVEVPDLEAVVAFCRARKLVSLIDSTVTTPVNFTPLAHGFDLVLHSATKYLNGHSDVGAGVVVGSASRVAQVKHKLDHLGGSLDPHACFLLHRGLKTLALRVRHQNESALALATALEQHPAISKVFHPFLSSHPASERARRLFKGASGLFSFELKGGEPAAARLFERLELPINAPSLGGPETLVTLPALTSHAGLSAEVRRAQGISDGLVRISVGLEATEDLIEDFRQALE